MLESSHGRKRYSNSEHSKDPYGSDVYVVQEGEKWLLKDPRKDLCIELPPLVGKAIYLNNHIANKFRDPKGNSAKRFSRKYDCHTFVHLALGLISVKDIKGLSPSEIAEKTEHWIVDKAKIFEICRLEQIKNLLPISTTGVYVIQFAYRYEKRLAHSAFLIKSKDTLYISSKNGWGNSVQFEALTETELSDIVGAYGNLVSVAKYEDITKPD